MKQFLPILRRSALFDGLNDGEILSAIDCLGAKERLYGSGEALLGEGDEVKCVGLVLTGSALVTQGDFWGNRNLLARVEPGDLFAEVFACSPETVSRVDVTADGECRALWLDVSRVLAACPSACPHHSRIIRNLVSLLSGKNLKLSEKLTHMAQRTTRDKLLSYLSGQARLCGSPEFDIPFDRQELADYLSVDRSAMSAELGRLRDDGRISFQKNHFRLLS